VTVHADSIKKAESFGLRAVFRVSDGVNTTIVDVSRSVINDTVDGMVTLENEWTPIRVAGVLDDPDVTVACVGLSGGKKWSYDNTVFRVFGWFPDTGSAGGGKWHEWSKDRNDDFAVDPGRVIWAKTKASKTLSLGSGYTTPLSSDFGITLPAQSWTDISIPYKFEILLCDILKRTEAFDTSRAVIDTLQIVWWEKGTEGYTAQDMYVPYVSSLSDVSDDTLKYSALGEAYSVYNPFDAEVTLQVPPLPVALTTCPTGDLSKRASRASEGWDIGVHSRVRGGIRLHTIRCGVTEGAPQDYVFPLRPSFGRVGVGVVHGPDNLLQAHAVLPELGPEGGVAYEIVYFNDGSDGVVVDGGLEDLQYVPEGLRARVYTPGRGAYEPESESFVLKIPAGQAVSRWVVAGDASYLAKFASGFPKYRLALLGAFPNPFRGRVAVRYSLPYEGMRDVVFGIYDMRGRRVWEHRPEGRLRPGHHTVTWDGRDSRGTVVGSGTYLLRMHARSQAGESKSFKVRLTYVR
jgi:hypothetical protein